MPRNLPIAVLSLTLLLTLPVSAQGFRFPEQAANLRVLPKDTGAEALRGVMQGFTRALGVRCAHCHVGPEGASMAELDYASDDKAQKEIARVMMRMTRSVNADFLAALEGRTDLLRVTCETCHRGAPRPTTLADEMTAAWKTGGVAAAIERHGVLLERFGGGYTYDFRPASLDRFGAWLVEAGHPADAIAFYRFVLERHPTYGEAHVALGQIAVSAGDTATARAEFEAALALDPRNRAARAALDRLGGGN